jgi:hypothetical protein
MPGSVSLTGRRAAQCEQRAAGGVEVVGERDVQVGVIAEVACAVQHRGEVGVGPALGDEADREPGGRAAPCPCAGRAGVAVVHVLAQRFLRPRGEPAVVRMTATSAWPRWVISSSR